MTRRHIFLRSLSALLAAAVFIAAGGPVARALDTSDAKQLVTTIAEKGIEEVLTADVSDAEKIEKFRTLFTTYFDIPSIARFVLGRNWRSASKEEQDRFVDLFREVNVYTWARRFKDYNGERLMVVSATEDGDKGAFVDTKVEQTGGQEPLVVRWRLRARNDGPMGMRVVDLVVEGVSMAITYRSEYASVIQNQGGVRALNDLLARQLEQLRT
jgi:phospholipid transport system substrate-binding protein